MTTTVRTYAGMKIHIDDEGYMRNHPERGGWLCLACKNKGMHWGVEWPVNAEPPVEKIQEHKERYHGE